MKTIRVKKFAQNLESQAYYIEDEKGNQIVCSESTIDTLWFRWSEIGEDRLFIDTWTIFIFKEPINYTVN